MKKIVFSLLLLAVAASAQAQFTNLHENFDVNCVLFGAIPHASGWSCYNAIPGTVPDGQWSCTPTMGRPNTYGVQTPGIMCTGTYGGAYHLDTSYLISPLINVNSDYGGNLYLRFDSKTNVFPVNTKLHLIKLDTNVVTAATIIEVDSLSSPVISGGESPDWVTYQVDLTRFKSSGGFFIGFRYSSSADSGSVWFIDNVSLSSSRLSVPEMAGTAAQLYVSGVAERNHVALSFGSPAAGSYTVALTDMMGRVVYQKYLRLNEGVQPISIDGLALPAGMYLASVRGDNLCASTKIAVR